MEYVAVGAFLAGLLLAVRVMFFGVQRQVDEERLDHRRWPLALAAFLTVSGALLYARASRDVAGSVTPGWWAAVVLMGMAAGCGAWWLVQRSAGIPSTDPEDDPRYRFQGHVARVTETIEGNGGTARGRISFDFDGKRYDFRARWSESGVASEHRSLGTSGSEVVIEIVDGDLAYVEPWSVVEQRL